MGVCARAGRGQQDKQNTEDEDLYLGFSLCWALCACTWPKAEPCVGVCGHVSVEVISLNFLLKCQLTCSLVERVNTRIDRLSFSLCSGEQQRQGRSATCFWEQAGVQGLNQWGFLREVSGLILEGTLLSCYLLI